MNKSKVFKLGGLVGFAVAVGYGLYKKKKMTIEIEPMPEAIDISVEKPKEEGSRK